MAPSSFISPSQAAKRLGVSAKALRLYEEHGLMEPGRSEAGWRCYGPDDMERAVEIVALRELGLNYRQIAQILNGDCSSLQAVLARHQSDLESEIAQLGCKLQNVRKLRADVGAGSNVSALQLTEQLSSARWPAISFELPWPWGGETFELHDIRDINYITGPLGSGKTRLAKRLAESVTGGEFVDLDRRTCAAALAALEPDRELRARVLCGLEWIEGEGGVPSATVEAILALLEGATGTTFVIDMIEQSLDEATQRALIAYLRQRSAPRPLFLMTRSTAILDLSSLGPGEAVIFCPANHSPPMRVETISGAPGFEAVETCLAPPDVRARTEGVLAMLPRQGTPRAEFQTNRA